MIHQRGRGRGRSEETIFGSPESELTLPKYRGPPIRIQERGHPGVHPGRALPRRQARQNLATFCQTYC